MPKKVLVVTDELLAPSLYLTLKNEGCDVALAMKRPTNVLKGTLKRIDYATRMEYAKDCDLIVYEDKSCKGEPTELRKQGLSVIGGDSKTDKLELDRVWANKLAKMSGLLVPEMVAFDDFAKMKEFILDRKGKWVLKQCGKIDEIKGLSFVSKMDNSEDLLDFLPILEKNWIPEVKKDFVLQEKIEGHEMAIGSFFNGTEFMKDKDGDELCEENFEHKALCSGNLGESTGEQYTVQRMVKAKYSKLFSQTLDKCREILKNTDFRGDFDVNTIINEKGAWFLEFTPRMGVPATSGMLEFHKSSWYDLLKAMADGKQPKDFKYDPRWCIISWIYTKPFPAVHIANIDNENPQGLEEIHKTIEHRMSNSEGILVNFKKDFTTQDWKHVHPDGLRFKDGRLQVADGDGYVATVSEQGETVEEAGEKVDTILHKIVVPKAFWRNDFHKTNYHTAKQDLIKWGYLEMDAVDKQAIEDKKKEDDNKVKEEKRKEVRAKLKKIVYDKKD